MRTSLKCFLTAAMVFSLTSCGGKESASKTYLLTFHQDGVADTSVTVTKGETTNDDVKAQEPTIVSKEGYTGSWVYDVATYTTDTTISPTYTPITYYATYKASGRQVGEPMPFTVEDTKVPNEPAVPEVAGYEGSWNDYTITAADMTITAKYEIKTYTASFVIGNETIATVGFTINDLDLDSPYFPRSMMPEVPESSKKAHYDVEWEDKLLDPIGDVTITLTEKLHEYGVKFVDEEGNQVGEVQTYTYGQDKSVITEPTVPAKEGYTAAWDNYTLTAEEDIIVVSPAYTPITYYATFFADGVQVGEPVPFTVEDTEIIGAPEVPAKEGYEGEWEAYTIVASNIEINADYHYHRYYISFQLDGQEVETVSYTVEDNKSDIELPEIPEKTGYMTAGWENFDLTYSDELLVVKANYYLDVIDFESGTNPEVITAATLATVNGVTEGTGARGSKALEITVSAGDFYLNAPQSFLDAAFANEEVKSIDFDAKASIATNNFRNGAGVTFEVNSNGYGITTQYKTFHYTRAMYDARTAGEKFIKGSLGADQKLYIDNIRTSTADYLANDQLQFEDCVIEVDKNNANNRMIRRSKSSSQSQQIGLVSGAGASVVDFDSTHTTSGNNSLHITKVNGYLSIYTSKDFYNSLPEEGMLFDIYTDINNNDGTNASGIALYNTANAKFQWLNNWGNPDDGWVTYHLTKAEVGTDGRFLILQGSPNGEVYIDNIRAATSTIGFEDGYAKHQGDYNYFTSFDASNDTSNGSNMRDVYRNYQMIVNGANMINCGIDRVHTSEGKYAFRIDVKDKGYCAMFLNIQFIKAHWDKGIKFDVYSEGVTFTGGSLMSPVKSGQWTTITISKADFETTTIGGVAGMPNGRFFKQNANTAGSFWIDNIRAA